jgi:hypothetical protein
VVGKEHKLRPSGEPYSSDPRERHAQLVGEGKIGGRGSEVARAHELLGGRPGIVKPTRLQVPAEDMRELIGAADAAEREAGRLLEVARRLRRRADAAGSHGA